MSGYVFPLFNQHESLVEHCGETLFDIYNQPNMLQKGQKKTQLNIKREGYCSVQVPVVY